MRAIWGSLLGAMLLSTGVDAMPMANLVKPPALVQNAKVVCAEDGHCYRPPRRRPVATWVYGDNNFVGPYDGPGYYGSPRYRYRWWPFYW
jgi:hypothetical protein